MTMNKTALITGASKRIGYSISKFLAIRGYNIALHYNTSEQESNEVVNELKKLGCNVKKFKLDLFKTVSIKAFFKKIVEHFGQVDLLINNASIFELDSLDSCSFLSLDKHLNINLKAPLFLSKYFVQSLNSKGNIINILDQRVLNITPYFTSYTLSKCALWTLTQSLALSLAPRVRVNAIAPGPTLKSDRQSKKQFLEQIRRTPLKKQVSLDDINSSIDLIIKSRSMTGQLILLDSGQNLGWAHSKSKKLIDD